MATMTTSGLVCLLPPTPHRRGRGHRGSIDGDEGQVPQVLAVLQVGSFAASASQHGIREGVGMPWARMAMRLVAVIWRIAEPVGDAGVGAAETSRPAKLEADELADLGVVGGASRDPPLFQLLPIDGR